MNIWYQSGFILSRLLIYLIVKELEKLYFLLKFVNKVNMDIDIYQAKIYQSLIISLRKAKMRRFVVDFCKDFRFETKHWKGNKI